VKGKGHPKSLLLGFWTKGSGERQSRATLGKEQLTDRQLGSLCGEADPQRERTNRRPHSLLGTGLQCQNRGGSR